MLYLHHINTKTTQNYPSLESLKATKLIFSFPITAGIDFRWKIILIQEISATKEHPTGIWDLSDIFWDLYYPKSLRSTTEGLRTFAECKISGRIEIPTKIRREDAFELNPRTERAPPRLIENLARFGSGISVTSIQTNFYRMKTPPTCYSFLL